MCGVSRSPIAEEKRRLRAEMNTLTRGIDGNQRTAASKSMASGLITFLADNRRVALIGLDGPLGTGDLVLSFESYRDEIDTCFLNDALRKAGMRVAYPRVTGDALEFSNSETRRHVEVDEAACVLVPARAFDRSGARLGRGGGHYDRLFAAHSAPPGAAPPRASPVRIGIAYARQVIDHLPVESHDMRVTAVATEEGVLVVDSRR